MLESLGRIILKDDGADAGREEVLMDAALDAVTCSEVWSLSFNKHHVRAQKAHTTSVATAQGADDFEKIEE